MHLLGERYSSKSVALSLAATGNFFSHQINPIGIMEGHRIGEKMVIVEGKGKWG